MRNKGKEKNVNSLAVQWLGLCAFTAKGPGGQKKKLKKKKIRRKCQVRSKLDILKVFSSLFSQTSPQIIENTFNRQKYSLFL